MQIEDKLTRARATIRSRSLRGKTVDSSTSAQPSLRRLVVRFFLSDPIVVVDLSLVAVALWAYYWSVGALAAHVAAFAAVVSALLLTRRMRRQRLIPSALQDAGDVCKRVFVAFATAALIALLIETGHAQALVSLAAGTAGLLLVGRAVSYAVIRWARRTTTNARVLVVGTGAIAGRVVAALREHPEYGLSVMGATGTEPPLGVEELGAEILGPHAIVPELLREHDVHGMIVAPMDEEERGVLEAVRTAMANDVAVWVVPKRVEFGMPYADDHLWGLPVVRLQPLATNRPEWLFKRTFDVVVAGLGLLLTAPLQAVIALLVYMDSGPPILLRQLRVGQDGRDFTIFKFRTMTTRNDSLIEREWHADAARITRVGHVLRASDLDELPQLFNVLRGDMSLVGPRPERPFFVNSFISQHPQYEMRHRLPVGMTGWAQIHGLRGDTSIEERVAFDNYYIETWSPAQDVLIVVRTVINMMRTAFRVWGAGRAR